MITIIVQIQKNPKITKRSKKLYRIKTKGNYYRGFQNTNNKKDNHLILINIY